MNAHKLVPHIWFCTDQGGMSKMIDYYKNIFDKDFLAGQIIPLGETPSGKTEMCTVQIFGLPYSLMSTAKEHHPLNDAISIIIYCKDQHEIDKYWNYFTHEGNEAPCGWCIDKYGLRWQVLPHNLGELMSKPTSWNVMMKQKKIVIEEYLK